MESDKGFKLDELFRIDLKDITTSHFITQLITERHTTTPNLNTEIVQQLEKSLGLTFVLEAENGSVCFANNNEDLRDDFKLTFTATDLLNYIYAVLHSPSNNINDKKLLKIEFPFIPYSQDSNTFWQLVKKGC